MKKHLMVDLETLSFKNNALIIAIGARIFTSHSIDSTNIFYHAININSSKSIGFDICPKTIEWWNEQDLLTREEAFSGTLDLEFVLNDFREFVLNNGIDFIWGNGATFDNVILKNAFDKLNIEYPVKFYKDRCYRTLADLRPDIKKPDFSGGMTKHNALDDATIQAVHASQLLRAIEGVVK